METKTSNEGLKRAVIKNVDYSLDSLKNYVIGIFKHPILKEFELVIAHYEDSKKIDTIMISQFGAINRGYRIPYQNGKLLLFPDGKNMNEMLDNPTEWAEFLKKIT